MATLTWRDVAAPSFSGVSEAQRLAATLLNEGFGNLRQTLNNQQKTNQDVASNEFLARASQYTDANALGEALRSGTIYDGLNRGAINPEAYKYVGGRQSDLNRNQEQLLVNEGRGIANDTNQFNLTTAQRDDQQAQARLAAQPAAADLLAKARTLSGSGNAADVETARKMLSDNTQTLINAGYKADAIPGLLDAERGAGTAGFGYKKEVLENDKFWENQGVSTQARSLANDAINGSATPDMAIRSIQENRDITDPRVKAQSIQVIQAAADSRVFATATEGQQLLTSLGINPVAAPAGRPAAQPARSGSLVELVDRTEGGGSYDTLFGHSQRDGGAFAGIKPSTMTLDQLDQFDGQYGPWVKGQLGKSGQEARIATPVGRFQIVGTTRRAVAKEMGLDGNTVFTPEVQNAMFYHLVDKRISGPRTMQGKIDGLRQEWEGFKSVSNDQLARAITAYEGGDRSALTSVTQGGSAPVATGSPAPVAQPQISMPVGTSPAAQLTAAVQPATSAPAAQQAAQPAPAPAQSEGDRLTSSLAARDQANAQPVVGADGYVDPNVGIREAMMAPAPEAAAVPTGAQAQAAQLSETVAPLAAPIQAGEVQPTAPVQGTPTSPTQMAQTLGDQQVIDQAFNANAPLYRQIVDAQNSTESIGQVVKKLIGEGGSLQGMNEQAALAAINETIQMSGNRLKPAAAAALVAQNPEARDLTSVLDWIPFVPGSLVNGDKFGGPDAGGSTATRINMEGVKADLDKIGFNVDGSISISRGTSGIQNQRASNMSAQVVAQVQGQLLASSTEVANLEAAISRGQDTPQIRAALDRARNTVAQLTAILQQVGAEPGSPTTIFTGQGEGRPVQ